MVHSDRREAPRRFAENRGPGRAGVVAGRPSLRSSRRRWTAGDAQRPPAAGSRSRPWDEARSGMERWAGPDFLTPHSLGADTSRIPVPLRRATQSHRWGYGSGRQVWRDRWPRQSETRRRSSAARRPPRRSPPTPEGRDRIGSVTGRSGGQSPHVAQGFVRDRMRGRYAMESSRSAIVLVPGSAPRDKVQP